MNNNPLFSNKRSFKYSLLIGYYLYDRLRRFPPNKLPRPLTLRQTHCRFFLVDHSYDTYINQIKIKNVVSHKRGSFVFYLSHDPWQTHTHTSFVLHSNGSTPKRGSCLTYPNILCKKQNGRPHLDPSSFANTHTRTHTSFVLIHCE